jgi:16S rRNA (adenine1518-N6/adenine1519-N6)-dimethyltransferase
LTPSELRRAVRAGEIRPQKSLGQNFLVDLSYAERIVDAADIGEDDDVIEVGPGMCALTKLLCERARRVVAVEIDKFLIPKILREMRGIANFRLVHADILKMPLERLLPDGSGSGIHSDGGSGSGICSDGDGDIVSDIVSNSCGCSDSDDAACYKVVSNLPYSASSQIMMHFLDGVDDAARPRKMVLMMQKEVADRLVAQPATKAYGALTVAANFFAEPRRAFNVPAHCFVPQPGVDSTVVTLDTRSAPPCHVEDRALFFCVLRAAFAQRRKTLENCLIHAGLLPKDRNAASAVLAASGVSPCARGETLSLRQFADISNALATGTT